MTDATNRPPQLSHAIVFAGAIATPQSTLLRNQLAFLNQPSQPNQNILHLPCTGLLIVLSSWGGNLFETRSLYELIRALPYYIEIHAVGHIKSSALPLLLSADRRTCTPATSFFFHPWTWGTELHPGHTIQALQQPVIQLEDDVDWGRDVLLQRTKLTEDKIDEMELFDKGVNTDSTFAVDHGLVHEVVERKIPPQIMTWNIA